MITDIQKYLSQFYQGTKNPNLETMKYFTKKLNHPENVFKIIHIAGTNGKGRFEQISTNPTIIYDGGHNEEAIKNFKHSVEMYYKDAKKVYLICSLKTKDHKTILKELLEDINATFIVHDGIRSSEGKTLNFTSKEVLYAEALNINKNANVFKMDLLDSLKYVEQNFKDRVVFIIGSFYIYGAVADYLANLKV